MKCIASNVIALTAFYTAGLCLAQPPIPTIDEVVRVWENRQDKVTSARFEIKREQTIYKGSTSFLVSGQMNKQVEPASPPRDYLVTQPVQLTLDGAKLKHSISRQLWDPIENRIIQRSELNVFDGKMAKTLMTPTNGQENHPSGWKKTRGHSPLAQRPDIRPLIYAVRGNHPQFFHSLIEFKVSERPIVIATRSCLELVKEGSPVGGAPAQREVLYLDRERDYVVVRRTTFVKDQPSFQLDVTYSPDRDVGWLPSSWEYIIRVGTDDRVQDSARCKITSYELNPRLSASEFDLEFPAKTRVFDDTVRPQVQYIVKEDGEKGRQILSTIGPTYEDLNAPIRASKNWLAVGLWVIVSLLALFGLLYKRLRTKSECANE